MKINKIINILLALSLVLSMVACSPDETPDGSTPDTTPSSTPEATTPEASTPESAPESSTESGTQEKPKINFMELDLSKYITLGQYKGFNLNVTKKKVVDEEYIMSFLNSDLIYYGYTEKVTDRAVTKDDTVKISYKGLLDGVAFEGGTGDKDNFTIYDGGGFIPGFADGVIGAMPGVEIDVNVTFPEEYHSADLAGKAVVFKVTVHHIYEAKALTDELANELTSGEYKTAAALKEYYKTYLEEQEETTQEDQKLKLTWEAIHGAVTKVKAPDEIVDLLFDYEFSYYESAAKSYGLDVDTLLTYYGLTRETLKKKVEDSVFENMVLYSIIKAEGLTLSDEEYNKTLEEWGYTEEELLETYTKEEIREQLLVSLTYYNAIDWQTFTEVEDQQTE